MVRFILRKSGFCLKEVKFELVIAYVHDYNGDVDMVVLLCVPLICAC